MTVNVARHPAYVTNDGDNTVSVIDTQANTVIATIPVGSGSIGVAVDPRTNRVYTANLGDSMVSVIGAIK